MFNLKISKKVYRVQMTQFCAFLGILILSFFILAYVPNMLLSFVCAVISNYLLEPVVDALERAGLKRLYSIILVFIVLSLLLAVGAYASKSFIVKQVLHLQSEWSNYLIGFENLINKNLNKLQFFQELEFLKEWPAKIEDIFSYWATSLFEDLPRFLSNSLITFFLAPFITFFILLDGYKVSRKFLKLAPNSFFEIILDVYYQIHVQMGHFIRARMIEASIVGFLVFLGLYIFGFSFPVMLGFFAFLTNLIPYIGPIIGFIPGAVLALSQQDPGLNFVIVSCIYFFAQLMDTLFLIPLVVAKIVNLHPVSVVIVIVIGAQLMGILGMFIAIPVTCMLKVVFTSFYKHLVGHSV